MKPPKPCLTRRCPQMAARGKSHCAEHQRPGTTAAWRKTRDEALRRAGHRCERCGSNDRLQVHHLDHDWRNDDPRNLEVVCHACHWLDHTNEATKRKRARYAM